VGTTCYDNKKEILYFSTQGIYQSSIIFNTNSVYFPEELNLAVFKMHMFYVLCHVKTAFLY
jgi:hypothetical protein